MPIIPWGLMTALTKFFFRDHAVTTPTASQTIAWWESRRPVYNLAVGAAGAVTLAVVNVFALLPPHGSSIPWQANLILPAIYGVIANLCYTLGWATELGVRRWLGNEVEPMGAALFRYGFAFSIGLTLFPAGLSFLVWLARLASSLFFA